mmetsp:Transcript_14520/g.24192  ORF Transcript_14520/g.24192 Transcript_14520/m.24192 type:complete len:102 (+) Transcript_14520:89-394(+)
MCVAGWLACLQFPFLGPIAANRSSFFFLLVASDLFVFWLLQITISGHYASLWFTSGPLLVVVVVIRFFLPISPCGGTVRVRVSFQYGPNEIQSSTSLLFTA